MSDEKSRGIVVVGEVKLRTRRVIFFPSKFPEGVVPNNAVPTPENSSVQVTYHVDIGINLKPLRVSDYNLEDPGKEALTVTGEVIGIPVEVRSYTSKKGEAGFELVRVSPSGGYALRSNEEVF